MEVSRQDNKDRRKKKVQFHIGGTRDLAFDRYVECNFQSNQAITRLNVNDEVALWGALERALRRRTLDFNQDKVVFKDCTLSRIYARPKN